MAHLRRQSGEEAAVLAEVEDLLLAAHASGEFLGESSDRAAADGLVPDAAIGMRLGAWNINRLIGRGGMGEVYEATRADADFQNSGWPSSCCSAKPPASWSASKRSARILARLEHTGIARLYDGGVTGDLRPFMVMEYVEGRSITEYCNRRRATFEGASCSFLIKSAMPSPTRIAISSCIGISSRRISW